MSEHKSITLHDGTLFEYDVIMTLGDIYQHWKQNPHDDWYPVTEDWIKAVAYEGYIVRAVRYNHYHSANKNILGVVLPVAPYEMMIPKEKLALVKLYNLEERIQALRDSYDAVLALDAHVRTDESSARMDN